MATRSPASALWIAPWNALSRVRHLPALVGLALLLAAACPAAAATLPSGFSESYVGGIDSATAMAIAPDGRLFVCQQTGALRVIKNGVLLPAPFLTVAVDSLGERGLLGVAFDPDFDSNQWVYVYYTTTAGGVHNRVSRFTANGDVAAPGETPILDLEPLSGASNHNGGAIHFGPDRKLYVAVGENANGANAQTFSNRLGKLLRINADGSIPADNPFYATASGVNRAIWAYGLRNPFTFAFDPDGGGMFINDVGGGLFEEINVGSAGANYGWPITEGYTDEPGFTGPKYAYPHSGGAVTGCAISGAAFYSPASRAFPADYQGDFFFADLCGGWIRRLDVDSNEVTLFASGVSNPVDVHVAADGSLYYVARGEGRVYRVVYTAPPPPPPAAPVLTAFSNGLTLALSWTAPAGATSYRLEGGTAPGAADLLNVDVGNTTFQQGVLPAGSYFARVRAVFGGQPGAPSNEVHIVLSGGSVCVTPPPPPAGYSVQAAGLNASLAWAPAPGATSYILEAGSVSGAADLLRRNAGFVTALQTSGPPGTYYTRVRAANACGLSGPSAQVAVTLACVTAPPSGLSVTRTGSILTFRWNAAPGAASYGAAVGSAPGASNVLAANLGAATAIAFDITGVAPGRYYVRIYGQTSCGLTGASNEVIVDVQ